MLHQSELHCGSVANHNDIVMQVQVLGPGQAVSLPECQRQRRARTLSSPPPRTVEVRPQAYSITRSFMAALLQRQFTILQVQVRAKSSQKLARLVGDP